MFFYQNIGIAYSVINALLAIVLFFKARHSIVNQFYVFCVMSLIAIGILAYWISQPISIELKNLFEGIIVFLFSLCPFFFLHFMIIFVRRYDILKSKSVIVLNYIAGLFSYTMVLVGFIPAPIGPDVGVTYSGVVFYITWMSIYFSIGVGLVYELTKGFHDKVEKSNLLLGGFAVLLLALPGPFTESLYFKVFGLGQEWYFLSSTFALLVAVYFVFRHKVVVNTVYDAMKTALSVMNDLFVKLDQKLNVQMVRGVIMETLGYSEQELVGKPFGELLVQKYYLDEYLNYVNIKKMKEGRFDADVIDKAGKHHPFNFSLTPIYSAGELDGFVSIGRDIAEQKRFENIQNVVYKIVQVADDAPYLSELFPAIHEILKDVFVINNISIALYDDNKKTLTFPYVMSNGKTRVPHFGVQRGLSHHVVQVGKSLLCTRSQYDELVRRGVIDPSDNPPLLWLGAPLITERKIIGVIALQEFDDPSIYGEREREILEYAAVHIAKAIEQKRIEEEMRLLAQTVESINEIVTITDLDHKFTFVNNAFLKRYGYSKEEILGQHVSVLWSNKNSPQTTEAILQQSQRHGWKGEVLNVTKNGVEFPIELSTSQIRDSSGKVVGLVGIAVDITERQRVGKALEMSELRFRQLFENVPVGVYQSTPEGKFIMVNPTLVKMLGYDSAAELLATDIGRDIYANPNERRVLSEQLELNKELRNAELALKKKNGDIIYVLENAHAEYDASGRVAYFEGTLTDITERKRLEEELRHSQKMESIGTLVSGIAHDFNNILQIILMYSFKLSKDTIPRDVFMQSLDAINKSVHRGSGLIRQMLTFARKADAVYESVNVSLTVEELTKIIAETFPKNIDYSLTLDKHIPSIIADRNQIHQVLLNLCINARDAMPDGGKLEVRTELVQAEKLRKKFPDAQESHYACISVSDTGMGMDETTVQRIFEPFFTTKERGKGTGLGLSVVYGIMKSHNGYIDVESAKGKGTTFRVFFPVQVQSIKYIEQQETESISDAPGGTETILIVEDEETILKFLKSILEDKGYKVLIESDGLAAVQSYSHNHQEVSLVLMDVGLPKLDGWQAFLKMKEINAGVAVILASGYVDPHLKSERLEHGVKDIVQKPYVPSILLRKIRTIIDQTKVMRYANA